MSDLILSTASELINSDDIVDIHNPAFVYLEGKKKSTKRVMESALWSVYYIFKPEHKSIDKEAARAMSYVAGKFDRKLYSKNLRAIKTKRLSSIKWSKFDYEHCVSLRSKLEDSDLSPNTSNRYISAVRGVLETAFVYKIVDGDQLLRCNMSLKHIEFSRQPKGRDLSAGEIERLYAACSDNSNKCARDLAIISTLHVTGMRRAELVSLQVEKYNRHESSFNIIGKGNKERTVYLTGAKPYFLRWLDRLDRDNGPVFVRIKKNDVLMDKAITPQGVEVILRDRGNQVGVIDFTPHDFRRTLFSELIRAGADISTIQKALGHKDIKTTSKYDKRDEEEKKMYLSRIPVPQIQFNEDNEVTE